MLQEHLLLKNVAHKKIIKEREAALKNEAGGDEKHLFFTWPYHCIFCATSPALG